MKFRDKQIIHRDVSMGFDIEFALLNTKGKLVSAIPYILGTKDMPYDVDGGNIQRDNVAFEIAVDYMYSCVDLIDNLRSVLRQGSKKLPKRYRLSCIPSGIYSDKELKHPEAKEFGCDADYDAKTGNVNEFSGKVDPNLRSFGFHVHTGWGEGRIDPRIHVLASDLTLGLFSAMKDNSEAAMQRRLLYGKPSCYRIKPYGVEYRTLSNYFCKSPRLIKIVYLLNQIACAISSQPGHMLENVDMYEVSNAIINNDTATATEMFFEFVFNHMDDNMQSMIIDELEHGAYKSLQEEWSIDIGKQTRTVNQALRHDYYPAPEIQKEMLA